MNDRVVYATPWFELVAKYPPGYSQPHYSIRTRDYVTVVAVTDDNRFLLVRQFRPAVGRTTLELPSGHVENGETPESAARKELLEETGYVAETFECLGDLSPDTGRLANRLWCFFAAGARPSDRIDLEAEPGIEPILFEGTVSDLIDGRGLDSALNLAALSLAIVRGRLPIRG
jgi:8-oxo-dGTP pyrophosphatase MutT (NUDIX family)